MFWFRKKQKYFLKEHSDFLFEKPATPLLDMVNKDARLVKELNATQLHSLANELREELLYVLPKTGGHFSSNLGVVELTVALHHVLDLPQDRLIWDVGHQGYPHKMLSGRRDQFHSLRAKDGISGFLKRSESEYDAFGAGHSSTSISAALGMAIQYEKQNIDKKVVAVIGDGAMTAGMAYEALAHGGAASKSLCIILNDNAMSISENVGGVANYFARIWASKLYMTMRRGSFRVLRKLKKTLHLTRKIEEHMKGIVAPGTLFEELGYTYIGPLDGHDINNTARVIRNLFEYESRPWVLHVSTMKGRGYIPAEQEQIKYHAIAKTAPKNVHEKIDTAKVKDSNTLWKYQDAFGEWLCYRARIDANLVGITPAMCIGSGMQKFSTQFPDQYYDVAIAEQHAVTLAAGMATADAKPVVAIYSTFLQRAYDQLIHDVCIQNLDVTFAIDRAGVVGEDGATHSGSFDLSFLRCIPNLIIAAPSDINQCWKLLNTCFNFAGPAAIRYPKGVGKGQLPETNIEKLDEIEIGSAKVMKVHSDLQELESFLANRSFQKQIDQQILNKLQTEQHSRLLVLSFGGLLDNVMLASQKIDCTVLDMRFIKPLDTKLLKILIPLHKQLVTIEDNAKAGGAGSAVLEFVHKNDWNISSTNLGIDDSFVDQGAREQILADAGLSVKAINKVLIDKSKQPKIVESFSNQSNK